ncbi:hypothetical protein [Thermasporomyces composti]|uniref:hypothetical protein n=1 Tax=Thermasporomyces composti TaxID=696763 RepID=UPI001B862075|nr:hypothetical protein [Thermasporomyces composti]
MPTPRRQNVVQVRFAPRAGGVDDLHQAHAPRTGRYELGDDHADTTKWQRPLSYADLAVAALDQIERPTRHREQVAVYGA